MAFYLKGSDQEYFGKFLDSMIIPSPKNVSKAESAKLRNELQKTIELLSKK